MAEELSWPFEAVLDGSGRDSGWIALHGPIVTAGQQHRFAELRRDGAHFVGVTSYLDFPRHDLRDPLDYETVCEAWCHCFRDPGAYFVQPTQCALISASDFTDWFLLDSQVEESGIPAEFDYLYVGASNPWKKAVKNWQLAARCIPLIHRRLGLRALVIGQPDEVFPRQPGVAFSPPLRWPVLLGALARSRFLFVPNRCDPSPRVVAEALCLEVPVVMNREILGGWKYVNRFTGRFFTGEDDLLDATRGCFDVPLKPRGWFRTHFGPDISGRRLGALLRSVDLGLAPNASLRLSAAGPPGRSPA